MLSQVVAGVEHFPLLAATVVIVADLVAAACIVRILRGFTFSASAREQDRDAVQRVPDTDLVFVDTPKSSFLSSLGSCISCIPPSLPICAPILSARLHAT